jgi:hypothetical protein
MPGEPGLAFAPEERTQGGFILCFGLLSVLRLVDKTPEGETVRPTPALFPECNDTKNKTETVMTKNILLLAAVVGFGASSAFAADPTPSPTATPAMKTHKTHHKTHHKKAMAKPSASPSATPKA